MISNNLMQAYTHGNSKISNNLVQTYTHGSLGFNRCMHIIDWTTKDRVKLRQNCTKQGD